MTLRTDCARKLALLIAAIAAVAAITGCTFNAQLTLDLQVPTPTIAYPVQPPVQP